MPRRRLAWSCWNYLTSSATTPDGKKKANVDQVALWVVISQISSNFSINYPSSYPEPVRSSLLLWPQFFLNPCLLVDWMNDLQHISEKEHGLVLVTLNPPFEPRDDLVAGRYKYEHPVLDSAVRHALCIFLLRNHSSSPFLSTRPYMHKKRSKLFSTSVVSRSQVLGWSTASTRMVSQPVFALLMGLLKTDPI